MEAREQSEPAMKRTTVQRKSDRELVVTRTFDAPARLVFEAWSRPELFERWWVPKSMGMTLRSCEMDVRTGGTYRLNFGDGMDFFGRYLEVTPPTRIVWTNEEGGEDGSVTTVTFEEKDGKTLLVMSELYPVEGSARRGRHRRGGRHARNVRATGRAARHAPLRIGGPFRTWRVASMPCGPTNSEPLRISARAGSAWRPRRCGAASPTTARSPLPCPCR